MSENDADREDEVIGGDDDEGKIVEKTMVERAQEVGRDGAYLEVNAEGLLAAYRSGALEKAKIVVVKAARVELSEPSDVRNIVQSVTAVAMSLASEKPGEAVAGMSDEQASMWAFRELVKGGLAPWEVWPPKAKQ